jgi:hypothetical protein
VEQDWMAGWEGCSIVELWDDWLIELMDCGKCEWVDRRWLVGRIKARRTHGWHWCQAARSTRSVTKTSAMAQVVKGCCAEVSGVDGGERLNDDARLPERPQW